MTLSGAAGSPESLALDDGAAAPKTQVAAVLVAPRSPEGPSTAAEGPSTATEGPSTGTDGPSTAAGGPSTAAEAPSTAAEGPNTAAGGPSTAAAGLGIMAKAAEAEAAGTEGGEAGAATAAMATATAATVARKGRKRPASRGSLASHGNQKLDATAAADPAAPATARPKRQAKQAAAAAIAATAIGGGQRGSRRPAGVTATAAIAATAALAPEPALALAAGELQGGSEGAFAVEGRQGAKRSVRRRMGGGTSRAAGPWPDEGGVGGGRDDEGMQENSASDAAAAGVGKQRTVRAQRTRRGAAAAAAAAGPSGAEAAAEPSGEEAAWDGEREDAAADEQPPKSRAGRKGRGRGTAEALTAATAAEGKAAAAEEGVPVAAAAASPRKNRAGGGIAVLSVEEAAALQEQPLLDLGELVAGTLVRRPCAAIKTPYVADVKLLPSRSSPPPRGAPAATDAAHKPPADGPTSRDGGDGGRGDDDVAAAAASEGGRMVLAHAPALDCAGMIVPGSRLYLSTTAARRERAPPIATSHAIQLVEEPRPGGGVAVVGCHPLLAERLAAELLRRRCLEGPLGLGPYEGVDSQRTFGSTRVDFVLRMADGSWTLLEVKNVVCADFPEGGVPAGRPAVGVYTVPVPPGGDHQYQPTALFPHGAAKPKIKVVSDRAIKHVWELTQLHVAGRDQENGQRIHCAVLFIVNRSDCTAFRPCHEADPLFAQVVKAAAEAGVKLLAFDICWSGGKARLGKQLPVVFGSEVSAQYDPDRLREVLHFNATDPRKNWKAKANKKGKD